MDKREQTARTEYIKSIVNNLPDAPGCYQYLNDEGVIIYVGKAKNLKRRVSSYFNKEQQTMKTRLLVSKIADIKYIVVNSESDALLLENNLIKKHKPRYNVLLKDDKTYPSICITGEYYPRIFKTRKIVPGIGRYYGPYSNAGALSALLQLIKEMYPLRTCRLNLTPEAVRSGKFSPCLEYQIKNCCAPCISATTHEEYQRYIEEVRDILKGDIKKLTSTIIAEMQREAENLNFEKAQILKERYQLIENFRTRSEVVSPTISNVDVFSIESDEKSAFINFLHITNGCINQAFTIEYKKRLDESDEELLTMGIVEMRERFNSNAREIILPFETEATFAGVTTITVPQKGEKRRLLSLSQLNVKQYRADRMKMEDKLNPEQKATRLMKEIQQETGIDKLPVIIECFDNSNIQGSDAVAACVVFKKLKPSKKDYRKYNIKTVEGPDDYASMREVVRRRYSRALEEGTPLPHLILADGGKGQMEAIRQIVEDELHLDIPIAGLVKDGRHRTTELIVGRNGESIGLKQNSALFRLMTQIQDEVHRFAITFHRDKRSKRQTASELDTIKGIGEKSKQALLTHFKSVKRIKAATHEEVAKIIGESKAQTVLAALNRQEE
ncbi:MAG: excinuclease ABC subunit UvrC [Bacteroidales bacterium]|jgi:excinuclease ABC subunit C|nr:excinuclease ABC subunit UvrC [Bacteroidales bacterium]